MKFVIGKIDVGFYRLSYANQADYTLSILIACKNDKVPALFQQLVTILCAGGFEAVIEKKEITRDDSVMTDGFVQIRLLNALELAVIDVMRSHGIGIRQIA